jgi:hypothetical protein
MMRPQSRLKASGALHLLINSGSEEGSVVDDTWRELMTMRTSGAVAGSAAFLR